jgi:SAM-dependent methyltransferase
VSPDFLRAVAQRYADHEVTTLRVNGVDLAGLDDGSVDMAAAYSVLHHVPDYLAIVRELVRVVRPGGVIYLDHEVNENFWADGGCLHDFREALIDRRARLGGWWSPERKVWQRYLIPSKYVFAARMRLDPGWPFKQEGDIHVWPHDHIEWDQIVAVLAEAGAEVVAQEDYLVYRSDYPRDLWEQHRTRCSDMRLLIARRVR